MITIKKDLKELKKFDFEHSVNDTWFKTYEFKDEEYGDSEFEIIVNPIRREGQNRVMGCYYNESKDIDVVFDLDILYDIFKSKLLERIDEDESSSNFRKNNN